MIEIFVDFYDFASFNHIFKSGLIYLNYLNYNYWFFIISTFTIFYMLILFVRSFEKTHKMTILLSMVLTWLCYIIPMGIWYFQYSDNFSDKIKYWNISFILFGILMVFFILKDLIYGGIMKIRIINVVIIVAFVLASSISIGVAYVNAINFDEEWDAIFKNSLKLINNKPFEVSLYGKNLIYYKNNCTSKDVKETFFLHVFYYQEGMTLDKINDGEYKEQGLDFEYKDKSIILPIFSKFNGSCLASQTLSNNDLFAFRTGQFTWATGRSWEHFMQVR